MKKYSIILSLFIAPFLGSQTTLHTVSFETTSGYTTVDEFYTAENDYWTRTNGSSPAISVPTAYNGMQGSYFYAGEDILNVSPHEAEGEVITNAVDVSGCTNLQVKILVAAQDDALSDFEDADYLFIEYSYDGGGYTKIGAFEANGAASIYLAEDTNLDGSGNGTHLSPTFQEFTYSIPSSGTNLKIRVRSNMGTGSEEVAFDNIRIQGTLSVTFTNGADASLNFNQSTPSPPQDNWPFGQFSLAAGGTGATLSSVAVTLSGTYSGLSGATPFRLYAANSNNFGSASAIGSDASASGSTVTFSSLSDNIPDGTRYYWITVDLGSGASGTIDGTISNSGALTISGGTLNGSSSYGALNAGEDVSLPVFLALFTAEYQDASILLQWTTESEIDNLGFILDRREKGQDDWIEVATYQTHENLRGQGNVSHQTEYTLIDKTVQEGLIYCYRLSNVDFNGELKVLDVLQIMASDTVTVPIITKLEQPFPNPFNPFTKIKYCISEDSEVSLTAVDLMGRTVRHLIKGNQSAGNYSLYWNGRDDEGNILPSGIYVFVLRTDNTIQTQKVINLR